MEEDRKVPSGTNLNWTFSTLTADQHLRNPVMQVTGERHVSCTRGSLGEFFRRLIAGYLEGDMKHL